jgi:hypothetical protein
LVGSQNDRFGPTRPVRIEQQPKQLLGMPEQVSIKTKLLLVFALGTTKPAQPAVTIAADLCIRARLAAMSDQFDRHQHYSPLAEEKWGQGSPVLEG